MQSKRRRGKWATLLTKEKMANASFSFLEDGGQVTPSWWKTKGGRKGDLDLLGLNLELSTAEFSRRKSLHLARMQHPISMGH